MTAMSRVPWAVVADWAPPHPMGVVTAWAMFVQVSVVPLAPVAPRTATPAARMAPAASAGIRLSMEASPCVVSCGQPIGRAMGSGGLRAVVLRRRDPLGHVRVQPLQVTYAVQGVAASAAGA